jgi:hypothetical protein
MSSFKELPTGFINQWIQLDKLIIGHYAPFFHPGYDPAPSLLAGSIRLVIGLFSPNRLETIGGHPATN